MKKKKILVIFLALVLSLSFASANILNVGKSSGGKLGIEGSDIFELFTGSQGPFIFFEPSPETPSNNSLIGKGHFKTNTTIKEPSLEKVIYNFKKTNYTLYNDSLVGMWNFDNYTKFNDTSRYENDGSCYGSSCPTFNSSGKYNGAYEFDGNDDYVSINDSLSLEARNELTVSFWLHPDSFLDRWNAFIGKENWNQAKGWLIYQKYSKDKLRFGNAGGNQITGSWSAETGEWHHIVATYFNNGRAEIYVNSKSIASGTFPLSVSNVTLNIGSRHDNDGKGTKDNINGSIDEVRIWNRSLSEKEVKQHYMSNLRKFNETRWKLEVNQTKNSTSNLETGSYIYQSSAEGSAGYENSTEKRTINIDLAPPFLEFKNPTPSDGKTQTDKNATINISSNDIENSLSNDSLAHSTFLDFNKSLVGWWEMDWSNETGIYDNSTYNNFGTFNGGLSEANKTDGARGKGLDFDGSDDYGGFGNPKKVTTGSWTVVAWIKPKELSNYQNILGSGQPGGNYLRPGGYISVDSAGKLRDYNHIDGWIKSNTSVNKNNWSHVAFQHNSSDTYRMFVNGKLDRIEENFASENHPSGQYYIKHIGKFGSGIGRHFNGSLDSIQVYDKTLTESEIKSLYNASKRQYHRKFNDLETGTYNYTGYSIDKFANVNSTEQRTLTIQNETPTINASFPPNDHTTTNRTPKFNWTASDPEGDSLTYELNITCNPTCSSDDRYITGITQKKYVLVEYLEYLSDNGYSYNWSVRATDGNTYSNWTEERKLKIQSLVKTSVPQNSTDFGDLQTGEKANTTNGTSKPLTARNDGNVLVNTSINSTGIWKSKSHPNGNYQYKITENESDSYNPSGTQTTWTNMPDLTTHAIAELNWTNKNDEANIELYTKVPSQEPPGNRNSTIKITSSIAE